MVAVISHPACARHDCAGHPESQERLVNALSGVPSGVRHCKARAATLPEMQRVHLPDHIALVRNACSRCPPGEVRYLDPDTYITPDSFQVAQYAAGAAIQAVETALDGEHCLSLMRPPGHHALPHHSMGFCLFNNASIAAAAALGSVDRVAVVDWDVHHGNGTQYAWYHSDRVLYCSVHQAMMYPGSGMPWETGSGPGTGFTINAPLQAGCGRSDYALVFNEVFLPAIDAFSPGCIIVSAGQDCLADDLLGGMLLFPGDIGMMAGMLCDAGGLPLAIILEGGYSPSQGRAIAALIAALGGERHAPPAGAPRRSTDDLVRLLGTRD